MTTITVTAEHIAKGERESCCNCPVALAAIDALPRAFAVSVGSSEISVKRYPSSEWIDIGLPAKVVFFILAFDDGGHVEPFTFDLDVPAAVAA